MGSSVKVITVAVVCGALTGCVVTTGPGPAHRTTSGPPAYVVPEVRGRSRADIAAQFSGHRIEWRESDCGLQPNYACDTDPPPGSQVHSRTKIVVYLQADRPVVAVPVQVQERDPQRERAERDRMAREQAERDRMAREQAERQRQAA